MIDESYLPSPSIGNKQPETLAVSNILSYSPSRPLLNRIKTILKFLGPAFIVSVAYIDPGNFELEQFLAANNRGENLYGISLS